jgi:glycosyltransferase involved in cell wall biosynthesis
MPIQSQNVDGRPGPRSAVKLSVAMITYNHESFIRQALESVLAQRVNFDYEIVVGEDCSTDGTRAILTDFYHRYPERIVPLLHDQNLGALRNFQATLAACRGQYLAIVEADDYWTCEDKLRRQVDFLDQHPDYAICCHRAQVRDETAGGRVDVIPSFAAGSYTIEDLIAFTFISTCTVMYRWGSVDRLPNWFLDLKLGDWPLHILVARSGKIELMDEVMAVYRMHSGGMWTSGQAIDQKYAMMYMMKALDRHLGFQYTNAIHRTFAVFYFDMAIIERLNGHRVAALRYLAASLRNGGLSLADRWRALISLLAYSVFGIRRLNRSASELKLTNGQSHE